MMPSVALTPSQPFADEDDCLSEGSSEEVRCAHEALKRKRRVQLGEEGFCMA